MFPSVCASSILFFSQGLASLLATFNILTIEFQGCSYPRSLPLEFQGQISQYLMDAFVSKLLQEFRSETPCHISLSHSCPCCVLQSLYFPHHPGSSHLRHVLFFFLLPGPITSILVLMNQTQKKFSYACLGFNFHSIAII